MTETTTATTEVTRPERAGALMAAGELYRRLKGVHVAVTASGDPTLDMLMERSLADRVAKAQHELDDFRGSRAAMLALDALLPGWVYVDASDFLPKAMWRTFVSNDRQEWVDWLVGNGVQPEAAARLVGQEFDAQERRKAAVGRP